MSSYDIHSKNPRPPGTAAKRRAQYSQDSKRKILQVTLPSKGPEATEYLVPMTYEEIRRFGEVCELLGWRPIHVIEDLVRGFIGGRSNFKVEHPDWIAWAKARREAKLKGEADPPDMGPKG